MYWRSPPWYARRWVRNGAIVIVVLVVLTFAAVILPGEKSTPIQEILEHPDHFHGRMVTIRGTVTSIRRVPLLNVTFIKVQDSTGEIWCRFDTRPQGIQEHDATCVRGRVYKVLDIPFLGRDLRFVGIAQAQLCPMGGLMPGLR